MPITSQQIAFERQAERRNLSGPEARDSNNLEKIADSLEALSRNLIEFMDRQLTSSGSGMS